MITIAAAEAVSRPLGSYQVPSMFSFSHQHLMVIGIATSLLASEQDNDTPVIQKIPTLQGSIASQDRTLLYSHRQVASMRCSVQCHLERLCQNHVTAHLCRHAAVLTQEYAQEL